MNEARSARRGCRGVSLLLGLLLALGTAADARAETLTLFAAASLTDVGDALVAAWTGRGGPAVRVAYASSSTLARQIEAGAPADLFLSANVAWMDHLVDRGLVAAAPHIVAGNELVVVAPADTGPEAIDVAYLDAALGSRERLAVGDPDHVPAGRYAMEALRNLGLWAALEPRLARADHVRAALALVARGEAPFGIVYATDARLDAVRVVARVPADAHTPIRYPLGIVAGGGAARDLSAFLAGPETDAIWRAHGFGRPRPDARD